MAECELQGCTRKQVARGMCAAHYSMLRKRRTLSPFETWPTLCSKPGCSKATKASQLCSNHYQAHYMKEHRKGTTEDTSLRCSEVGCFYFSYSKGLCRHHYDRSRDPKPRRGKGEGKEARAKTILSRAKARAKDKGLAFNLGYSDLHLPDICPVLGIKLAYDNKVISDNSPSLDRIRSEEGYVRNNVWVISNRANRIKSDATLAELKAIVIALEDKVGL